jgi:chemotaxis family two-component system sensor kinase Cph1
MTGKEDQYEFFVRDNGIGIDPQYHQQIFDMFKRLHSKDQYEGTGAGLYIVKTIIEDHGGKIWVDSQIGQGATFYFTVPKDLKVENKNSIEDIQLVDSK